MEVEVTYPQMVISHPTLATSMPKYDTTPRLTTPGIDYGGPLLDLEKHALFNYGWDWAYQGRNTRDGYRYSVWLFPLEPINIAEDNKTLRALGEPAKERDYQVKGPEQGSLYHAMVRAIVKEWMRD